MDPAKLQAHLLASLAPLPNIDPIHITTLISTPRRVNDLYPHTPHPPRCFQMDYFVTLGVEVDKEEVKNAGTAGVTEATQQGGVEAKEGSGSERDVALQAVAPEGPDGTGTQSDGADTRDAGTTPAGLSASTASANPLSSKQGKTHLLTSAIFAHLYIIPSLAQSILYISKVDSSSYGPTVPLPLTRIFVASFISHFLLPSNRPTPTLRVQLFARSQGQYLFPNSVENPRKKMSISGGRLCGWWKGVYEEAVRVALACGDSQGEDKVEAKDVRLSYILPSYSAHEALGMLGNPKVPLPAGVQWVYEPPFSPSTTRPVNSTSGQGGSTGAQVQVNIADLIPSLEDDPKQRFLDELALNNTSADSRGSELASVSTADSVVKTNASGASGPDGSKDVTTITAKKAQTRRSQTKARNAKEEETQRRADYVALAQTSYEEYWERLGFRQECAQDTTGFFSCVVGPADPAATASNGSRTTDLSPVATATDIATSESGTGSSPLPSGKTAPPVNRTSSHSSQPRHPDPLPRRFQLPSTIVERLHKALLNTDFINLQLAQEGSAFWMDSMKRIVTAEIGVEGLGACTGVIEAKDPEVGRRLVEKRELTKVESVTVLQPRKKKRT